MLIFNPGNPDPSINCLVKNDFGKLRKLRSLFNWDFVTFDYLKTRIIDLAHISIIEVKYLWTKKIEKCIKSMIKNHQSQWKAYTI